MTAQDGVDNIRAQQGVPGSIDPGFHADQLQLVVDDVTDLQLPAYGDFSADLGETLQLTLAEQLVQGFSTNMPPVDMSVTNGVFQVDKDGMYYIFIERIYVNEDQNPSDQVSVTIRVEADYGSGYVDIFNRTAPISSATSAQEPAVLPFGTAAIRPIPDGATFRIWVSGEDNGASPQECYLARMKVTAYSFTGLPA